MAAERLQQQQGQGNGNGNGNGNGILCNIMRGRLYQMTLDSAVHIASDVWEFVSSSLA
jgi:hypothetical protein